MQPTSKGPHGRGPRVHEGEAPPANAGWFRPGTDGRRHQLTAEERRRGGTARGLQYLLAMHNAVYGSAASVAEAVEVGQLPGLPHVQGVLWPDS